MDLYAYHYTPSLRHKILSLLLLPFSALYGLIATLKRLTPRILYGKQGRDFGLPIISVGNLIAGGSGKTPFIIALCKHLCLFRYGHIAVVSRGYKRQSKGLIWVSKQGRILADVATSGDEPYLIASALAGHNVSVLVCKNRAKAIKQAKAQGAQLILLDDGFRFCFKKFDVILRPSFEPFYPRFIPSGLYRESHSLYGKLASSPRAIIAQENIDFTREVQITNPSPKMFLITAIANPTRLLAFLPIAMDKDCEIIGRQFFPDHHHFTPQEIHAILGSYAPTSLLTTQKDATKLQDFSQILSIMELALHIHPSIVCALRAYIDEMDSSPRERSERDLCIADYLYTPNIPTPSATLAADTPAYQSTHLSSDDPVQILCAIEKRIFASLARTQCPNATSKSNPLESTFSTSILLAWAWLPCDTTSVQNGLLDSALGILENAFCDGLVDFWLDARLYTSKAPSHTHRLSLAQSFPHRSSAWHYLFDTLFAPLCASIKTGAKMADIGAKMGAKAPEISAKVEANEAKQAKVAKVDSSDALAALRTQAKELSWDSPELFSITTLRIGLTKKGWGYYKQCITMS